MPGCIYSLTLSQDKSTIFVADSIGHLKQIDTTTNMIKNDFGQIHTDNITSIAVNDRFLCTGCLDGTYRQFSLSDGSMVSDGHRMLNSISALVISADDKFVFVGGSKDLKQVDLGSGVVVRCWENLHNHYISCMVVGRDCRFLYSAGWDAVVRRVSIADGKIVGSYPKVTAANRKIFLDQAFTIFSEPYFGPEVAGRLGAYKTGE
jgi:WD40 repeat protein